jgi:hypothetical protein
MNVLTLRQNSKPFSKDKAQFFGGCQEWGMFDIIFSYSAHGGLDEANDWGLHPRSKRINHKLI